MKIEANPIARIFMPISRLAALIGGYCILGLSFIVTAEIFLRKFFNYSMEGADELGGYAMAAVVAFGMSYTLLERAHTRIELILERLPLWPRAVLDVTSMISVAGLATFMAWRGFDTLLESIELKSLSGTPLMTPLWLPQSIWVSGLFLFALVSSAAAVHAFILMFKKVRNINEWYGIKSLSKEILEGKKLINSIRKKSE